LINCPFAVSAYFQKKKGHWPFRVLNPAHNHSSSLAPSAHTAVVFHSSSNAKEVHSYITSSLTRCTLE
jgi:hypothetical protein